MVLMDPILSLKLLCFAFTSHKSPIDCLYCVLVTIVCVCVCVCVCVTVCVV